jgi:O-antigen/teichoic acid export membrane protein
MRLLYRPWSYISITLTQSLLAAAMVLLFVLVFHQGILGFFLGAATASLLVALIGWYRARDYLDFRHIHKDRWPQLIRFGAPLLPAGVAMYFMTTADRWFVQYYHGPEAMGIFAVGAKFSMLMVIAVDIFRKAWGPIASDAMHSDDGPETFRMIARLYMGLGAAAVVLLTLLSPSLVRWVTVPAYYDSWPIVGILAWQALLYGFFLISSGGIRKAEKTYLNLYLMTGAALIGLVLNWFLVPEYGSIGAAIATVITYLLWATASMIVSEFLWHVGFSWAALAFQLTTASIFVAWYLIDGTHYRPSISLGAGLFVVCLQLLTAVEVPITRRLIRSFWFLHLTGLTLIHGVCWHCPRQSVGWMAHIPHIPLSSEIFLRSPV